MHASNPLIRHGFGTVRRLDLEAEAAVSYFMRTHPAAPAPAAAVQAAAPAPSELRPGEATRRAEAMRAAYRNGEEAGVRAGFTQGLHWGLVVGAVAGALAALFAVALMATLR